jgi:hypothetical protein
MTRHSRLRRSQGSDLAEPLARLHVIPALVLSQRKDELRESTI